MNCAQGTPRTWTAKRHYATTVDSNAVYRGRILWPQVSPFWRMASWYRRSSGSAHAAYAPWEAQNALDAAFMAYSGVSVLRQQLKPNYRVHGIVSGKDWEPNGEATEILGCRKRRADGLDG